MFQVNNNDTKMTSMRTLSKFFTLLIVSIVNFKQLIAWESARYVKIVYFNKFLSNAFLKSFTTISLFVTDLLNQD